MRDLVEGVVGWGRGLSRPDQWQVDQSVHPHCVLSGCPCVCPLPLVVNVWCNAQGGCRGCRMLWKSPSGEFLKGWSPCDVAGLRLMSLAWCWCGMSPRGFWVGVAWPVLSWPTSWSI